MGNLIKIFNFLWNYFMLKVNKVKYEKFPSIYGSIWIRSRNGQVILGNNLEINSNMWINPVGLTSKTHICTTNNAKIIIGNSVGISNSLIFARKSIIIEDFVKIGGGCQLLDNDFHSLDYSLRNSKFDQENVISKEILIKKGSFIGTKSIILKGVTIGENSIVAAGSVVASNIPSNEIWGGNPAKFIKKIK